jgi:asparagine synthase (glutamine-hydrolysing)
MADRIRHRGPDGQGQAISGPVGLSHKRLSIIDLATGGQPMSFDGVSVAFNGEIYNYVELRADLIGIGHRFRTASDTEVLLRTYMQYGAEGIARLNGMFAFVLHDSRTGRVVAARDHFGVKPLYAYEDGSRIIYASEIKAILADPRIRAEVDRDGLHDYVTLQYTLGERTLFRGVRKLLPAHYEVLDLSSMCLRKERYWRPAFVIDRVRSENEFVQELKSLLAQSVKQQMRSDVPVGVYLSGGLDSSTVAMLAAQVGPARLQAFTGAFKEGPEYDESDYARAVAEASGSELHLVHPTEREFVDLVPKLAYHMDEPAAGPGLFPQFIVSRLAAQHVKVCLGGQGGDEIFGGYARYVVAYFEQSLKSAIHGESDEGDSGIGLEAMATNLSFIRQYVPMLTRFMREGVFGLPERRYFALMDRSEGAIGAFSAGFRGDYDREAVFRRFRMIFNEPETDSYYNRMLHYDMMTGLPSLLQVEDRVSMAVSLESRVPLLDPRIVELIARIPPQIKFKGGEMKYLFKQAVRDLLPPQVLARRDKMGFPVPLQVWARGPAREFFCDVLLSKRARERGLYDMQSVEQLINEEAAFSRVLWGLLQLELWHREFIDAGEAR